MSPWHRDAHIDLHLPSGQVTGPSHLDGLQPRTRPEALFTFIQSLFPEPSQPIVLIKDTGGPLAFLCILKDALSPA
jgi:hypothetical protein